jgi:tRNA A-37 threonylcarbamoyl transferase component Bud32
MPADAPEGLCPRCLLHAGLPLEPASSDGPGFQPPALADLAPLFPHLELQELLGHGGMGAVYKARQAKLDRLVALKVLPRALAQGPGFAERFAREARALARLNHPNIVALYDFGEVEGLYFLLMEYVDGANLRQALAEGRLPADRALPVVVEVCSALQYAHDEGVVHRDVKPENILLDKKGRVKIADFGLAKLLGLTRPTAGLTVSQQVMGTPHYMAPEQQERPLEVDHRADIYSLGVVLYELLTGELPLGHFPPPSRKAAVDTRLDGVVLRALEREPQQRYQQMREMQTDVEAIGQPPAPAAPAPKISPRVWAEVGVTAAIFAGVALVVAFAVATQAFIPLGDWRYISLNAALYGFVFHLIVGNRYLKRLVAACALTGLASYGYCEWAMTGIVSWPVSGFWAFLGALWVGHTFIQSFRVGDGDGTAGGQVPAPGPASLASTAPDAPVPGLTPTEDALRHLMLDAQKRFPQSAFYGCPLLAVLPVIASENLAAVRKSCGVPPDERVLAILDLPEAGPDEEFEAGDGLVFGCRALYYHNAQGTDHPGSGSIPYAELGQRSFVNHGKEVYLGNDQFLACPEVRGVDCEQLVWLLYEIREFFAAVEAADKPGAKTAEPS